MSEDAKRRICQKYCAQYDQELRVKIINEVADRLAGLHPPMTVLPGSTVILPEWSGRKCCWETSEKVDAEWRRQYEAQMASIIETVRGFAKL